MYYGVLSGWPENMDRAPRHASKYRGNVQTMLLTRCAFSVFMGGDKLHVLLCCHLKLASEMKFSFFFFLKLIGEHKQIGLLICPFLE